MNDKNTDHRKQAAHNLPVFIDMLLQRVLCHCQYPIAGFWTGNIDAEIIARNKLPRIDLRQINAGFAVHGDRSGSPTVQHPVTLRSG